MALHIKEIKPLFNKLVTTGDKYEEDMLDNGIIIANKGDLKLYQTVLAVGSVIRDIQVGDQVMINPMAYARKKYDKNSIQNDLDNNPIIEFKFNWVKIYDEEDKPNECLLLNDRDIEYVFKGEEKKENVIIPEKKLIIS